MSGEDLELSFVKRSIIDPNAEEDAKTIFLVRLYEEVRRNHQRYASNGGEVPELSECVVKKMICIDDKVFTYNALRVLYSRYLSRNNFGKIIETPSMVFKRVALGFKRFVDVEKLYKLMIERKLMFNSPTFFNMYCNGARGALSACYVTPVYDDLKSIMEAVVVQALTFKYGGGQGFSFSNLRPRGSLVKGTGGVSSGPISFMKIYDVVTDAVKQGGKRRGANMGILHDWHPDIYNPNFDSIKVFTSAIPQPIKEIIRNTLDTLGQEYNSDLLSRIISEPGVPIEEAGFIQIKRGALGDIYLTNFNISVGIHDLFMVSVIEDRDWWMVNPEFSSETTNVGDYRIHYAVSRATGLGRLGEFVNVIDTPFFSILEEELEKSLGKALKIVESLGVPIDQKNPYAWRTKARAIWREIVRSAWESGDPGVIFLDNHNKWCPTPWLGSVVTTNPCGEQPLYPYESCNLGSISIEKYVRADGSFDLESFAEDIYLAVDALDAVIDLNRHPDERQAVVNRFTRKIGLGVMGLADALAKLGYPYDSEEAVAFTLAIVAALEVFSWKRSWELGKAKGAAQAFTCRSWDWITMKCLENEYPSKLIDMHTPALVKASYVVNVEEGWLTVKYHNLSVPQEVIDKLIGEARNRVKRDGGVKLVKFEVLRKVLEDVFSITEEHLAEALSMPAEALVESPRHLLALAVFSPVKAWNKLKEYGKKIGAVAPRNTAVTSVAPTGSISIIAGTSSGIEPYFALVYRRVVAVGDFLEVVKIFRDRVLQIIDRIGIDRSIAEKLMEIIGKNKGSIRKSLKQIESDLNIPENIVNELYKLAEIFPTTLDIDPWYHLAHQAAAQLYIDQAISKTINIPRESTEQTIETIFLVGWLLGLKGVTIYRDESKSTQVIQYNTIRENNQKLKKYRLQLNKISITENMKNIGNSHSENIGIEETEVKIDQETNSTCKTCNI
jgi:ribonucleoside-diphosphate reductase alpha chain